MTTVGYGDLVPTSAAERLVGAPVMLVRIGFLTVISAAITSNVHREHPAADRGPTTDALRDKLDQMTVRLDPID